VVTRLDGYSKMEHGIQAMGHNYLPMDHGNLQEVANGDLEMVNGLMASGLDLQNCGELS
jgi:hypothetical protein